MAPGDAAPSSGALRRPPLDAAALSRRLIRPGGLWRDIRVTGETASTNADLLHEAQAGAAEGVVLVAETQTAGRGRLGRSWSSPPRAALACSVLLRPAAVPPADRGWLPLLTGIAVAAALRAEAGVAAGLKWPNDVLVADRKIAGILAEAHDDAIVVGIGLNVTLTAAELPVPGATSLLLEDAACLDRERLLAAMLTGLADRYRTWSAGRGPAVRGAAGLRAEYLRWCVTVGREIRVELPTGPPLTGTAADVDETGRLAVRTGSGITLVGAGDVVHVR
jgi:BirA family transcriptional regulator, biotin operon repressor / biotin---[acetyl-CoA-carboxylase] ligase